MVKETLQTTMDFIPIAVKYTRFVNMCRKSHEVGKGSSEDVWFCGCLPREETPSSEGSFHVTGIAGN